MADIERRLDDTMAVILPLDGWCVVSYALAYFTKECRKPELAEELNRVHRAIVDQVIEGDIERDMPQVTAKTLAIYDPDLPRLLELARVVILPSDGWRSVSYALALTKKECRKPKLAEELSRVHRAIVDQAIEG